MSINLTPEDIEWIRAGYRQFADHDPAFLDRYTPDAKFEFPESLPAGGVYEGPWDALEFMTTVNERLEDPHPEPEEFIRDGDLLIVLCTWRARVPSTGRHVEARVAHVFRRESGDAPLPEQKVTSFEFIGDSAVFAAALAEAASG
jgi:ketosteroid isomerase-like protein